MYVPVPRTVALSVLAGSPPFPPRLSGARFFRLVAQLPACTGSGSQISHDCNGVGSWRSSDRWTKCERFDYGRSSFSCPVADCML